MASLTTALVGPNVQTLAPAPVGGAEADVVLIINLDLENSVNLGSSQTNLAFPLGPLASATLTAPVYAAAATAPLLVGIAPGGSSYSPGSLTITGPVTAEITGPVTVEGTVDIGAGSVGITGTVDVAVTGTPAVTITGTPTVDIASGSVDITAGNVDVTGVGGFFPPGGYTLLINDASAHFIPVNASYSTLGQSIADYQSYSLVVEAYCTAQGSAGGPMTIPVEVDFYADSGLTVLLDQEIWWMWIADSSANAPAIPFSLSGPGRGGYMAVSFPNGSDQGFTVSSIALYGSGRSLSSSDGRQPSPLGAIDGVGISQLVSVAPLVPMPGTDNTLANESSNTMSLGATAWLPLPLMSGTVSFRFESSNTLPKDFIVASAAGLENPDLQAGTGAQGIVWNPGSAADEYEATVQVGRAPLYMVIAGSASSQTTFSFIAAGVPA